MDKVFCSKTVVWENVVHTFKFFESFFSVTGYLKRSNETPTSLDNRLGIILTLVLIAVDCFSRF